MMVGGKHKRREHSHPLDIGSDDHTSPSENPTLLGSIDDAYDQEGSGEDRDEGPDHPIRRPPSHKHHSDPSSD